MTDGTSRGAPARTELAETGLVGVYAAVSGALVGIGMILGMMGLGVLPL